MNCRKMAQKTKLKEDSKQTIFVENKFIANYNEFI